MERDGLVAEIGKEAAQQIIDQDFEESKKSETGTKKSTTIDYGGSAQEIRSLDDLIYFKYIGKGEFSSVHLVKFKNDLYSLKAISKKTIAEKGIEKHIQNEKAVLTVVSHPFIMKYYRSFEDNKFIYLLTEYIHGMELFDAIRNIGTYILKLPSILGLLSTTDAKFYTGSLILFLEYMHTLGIVYRDLKPENIMVEESVNLSNRLMS